jgi:hypothetical protein
VTGVCLAVQAAYLAVYPRDLVIRLFFWGLLVTVGVVGYLSVSFLCWCDVFPIKKGK